MLIDGLDYAWTELPGPCTARFLDSYPEPVDAPRRRPRMCLAWLGFGLAHSPVIGAR